jgi:hypothetical protein
VRGGCAENYIRTKLCSLRMNAGYSCSPLNVKHGETLTPLRQQKFVDTTISYSTFNILRETSVPAPRSPRCGFTAFPAQCFIPFFKTKVVMNNFFRALIAGYGAKKLGGGCLGTVLVFIVIWVALGQCSWTKVQDSEPETQEIKLKNEAQASIHAGCIELKIAA